MRLHGYFRSTASWLVRIALNLKGVSARLSSSSSGRATIARVRPRQSARPRSDAGDRRRSRHHAISCHLRMARRNATAASAPSRQSLRASKNTCLCTGDRLRHPSCSEFEGSGQIALDVDTRGRCHSVGGLDHQGWTCRLRKAARSSARSILFWFVPNSRRRLPGAAALQRPPLRLRSIRIAAFVSGGDRLSRLACFCDCIARASGRR
jgi:hypothetical protein